MRHLSHSELLDIAEDPAGPALTVERRRHVDACKACRAEAAALRSTLTEARRDAGGEPSPLFWDHFAARVSGAIGDESPAAAEHSGRWWFAGPVAAWVAAALIVVLGTVVWRANLLAPASTNRAATAQPATRDEPAAVDDLDADQAWGVVRAAADGLKWDDAHAAGIGARPGSAERVAMELTPEERAELARLLENEMKRTGA